MSIDSLRDPYEDDNQSHILRMTPLLIFYLPKKHYYIIIIELTSVFVQTFN